MKNLKKMWECGNCSGRFYHEKTIKPLCTVRYNTLKDIMEVGKVVGDILIFFWKIIGINSTRAWKKCSCYFRLRCGSRDGQYYFSLLQWRNGNFSLWMFGWKLATNKKQNRESRISGQARLNGTGGPTRYVPNYREEKYF